MRPTSILAAALCLILTGTAFADGMAVPATPLGVASFDFTRWPLPSWRMVREQRFPRVGEFLATEDGMTNYIPEGADEKALIAAKDGLGIASAILDGPLFTDCAVVARMAFERKGAPAILLRTKVDGEITGDTLSLVIYHKGVNLWRFSGGKWSKVGAAKLDLDENVFYRVGIVLAGPSAKVTLDGRTVLTTDDVGLEGPGAVGVWSGEGPCHFRSMRISFPRIR